MRQLIRHILKENNIKQELKKVIEDDGLFKAADLVGGMTNLKSILKNDPEISSLFDKLTGTIIFYYSYVDGGHMKFPLKYEIIGRHSNIHKTNHWPEINVFYDENKLTPEENGTFKSMIKYLYDDAQHSSFKSKFNDGRIFNANYLTVKEINGENIDLIGGWDFSNSEVEDIHDKLYDGTESLNENINSETDKNLKVINVLLSLVSWDGLCDIWAEYNPDDKEYEIRSKTVTSNDLGASIFEIEEELQSLHNSIRSMGIRVYIYTPWYVDNCEDEVEFMNESENKEQSLQKLIDQYGLYVFMKMTGLDFNQVKSILNKMGNPKELLKQYISEFVLEKGGSTGENYGSLFALQIPLSDTKYVEDILVHGDDSIAVEIWEYHLDEYGHREQKDQYLTTINSLTNEELLSIISWMMEIVEGGYWD